MFILKSLILVISFILSLTGRCPKKPFSKGQCSSHEFLQDQEIYEVKQWKKGFRCNYLEKNKIFLQRWFTKNESYNIMDYLCQNYYINVNAYSSIRYLLSSIIIISDWYYYINEKDIQGKQIQPIVKRNCFYNRYCILKQLNEN